MAKYTINHTCGHTTTVQLFGAHADRERRIAYLESIECDECRKAAAAAVAAAQTETLGLAPLTGSEKQISWANSIRVAAYECLEALEVYATDESGRQMLDGWRRKMDAQLTAKWWIDNRFGLPKYAKTTTPEGDKQQARENVMLFNSIFNA